MTEIDLFLNLARRRVEVRRVQVWAIRGAAVSGVAAVLVELLERRWPTTSMPPFALGVTAAGVLVAAGGWLWGRPSLAEVARSADRCLGGRERVATAFAMATHEGALIRRQRADAEAWVATADPSRVSPQALPVRALGAGLVALALVAILAVLPDPGLARAQMDQDAKAARSAAADEVRAIADKASQTRPGEDPGRRQALISDLRAAEEALREAASTPAAAAALSRVQEELLALHSPGGSGRRSAASAAGAALAQAAPAAAAATALAGLDTASTDELQQLAQSLSGRNPETRAGLAAQLTDAAEAAESPVAAQQLQQAAERVASGDDTAARASLDAAARSLEDHNARGANDALAALANAVPTLSPAEQAETAKALDQASVAAAADPQLAKALAQAATALAEGRPGDAKSALSAAGKRALSIGAESRLDADVAEASNGVQSVKDALLGGKGECPSGIQAGSEAGDPSNGVTSDSGPTPTDAVSPAESRSGVGTCARLRDARQGEGVPGQGQGQGQGNSQGQGQRQGGAATGTRRGGGQQGAQGQLGQRPGLPNERVYVPGLSGPGRTRDLPGGGTGIGADAQGVPYETVYSQYRDAALTQSDRQLIPEATRQLLERYFQESAQ